MVCFNRFGYQFPIAVVRIARDLVRSVHGKRNVKEAITDQTITFSGRSSVNDDFIRMMPPRQKLTCSGDSASGSQVDDVLRCLQEWIDERKRRGSQEIRLATVRLPQQLTVEDLRGIVPQLSYITHVLEVDNAFILAVQEQWLVHVSLTHIDHWHPPYFNIVQGFSATTESESKLVSALQQSYVMWKDQGCVGPILFNCFRGATIPKPTLQTSLHFHRECDGCQASPIIGIRYRCTVCPNFDLCEDCRAQNKHAEHEMTPPAKVQTHTSTSVERKLRSAAYLAVMGAAAVSVFMFSR